MTILNILFLLSGIGIGAFVTCLLFFGVIAYAAGGSAQARKLTIQVNEASLDYFKEVNLQQKRTADALAILAEVAEDGK